jgi:hypothetical protein
VGRFDLRQYAREGARVRASELQAELTEIYRVFPDLRRAGMGTRGPATSPVAPRRRRRRKAMTAAQKKAVSARMKKYWAARRKSE